MYCVYFDCLNQAELTHKLKFTVIVMPSTTKNVKIVVNRYITIVTTEVTNFSDLFFVFSLNLRVSVCGKKLVIKNNYNHLSFFHTVSLFG